MGLFSKTKQKERSVLICHIESGAVHVALSLISPGSRPLIVYATSASIPFQEDVSLERLAGATLKALGDACMETVKKGISQIAPRRLRHGHIDMVYCVYGSPWYTSQTRHIAVEKKRPETVTRDMLNQLIKTHASAQVPADAMRVLEENVVGIRLNGYPVESPYGKDAQHIVFSVVTGMVGDAFCKLVADTVSHFFASGTFMHRSSPSTAFLGIRDTIASGDEFLLCDISAEISDISLIREGVLQETVTIPHGTRTAVRSFSKALGVLPEEVAGIRESLEKKTLDTKRATAAENAARKATDEWVDAFGETLSALSEWDSLPRTAFFIGDAHEFETYADVFFPVSSLKNPRGGTPIAARVVSADALKSVCLVSNGVVVPHPLLLLTALYVHSFHTMDKGK